jgi:hypothetical protein
LKFALTRATEDQIRGETASLLPKVKRLLMSLEQIGPIRGLARIIDCRPDFREEVLEKFPMNRNGLMQGGSSNIVEVMDVFYPQEK